MKSGIRAGIVICALVLIAAVAVGISGIWNSIGYDYANAEAYTAGGASVSGVIRHLDVDWVSGRVAVAFHASGDTLIEETCDRDIPEDLRLRWWLDGDTLRVRFAKRGRMQIGGSPQKTLTLTLPEDISLQSADISATSADLEIPALQAERLKLSTTSGGIRASASVRRAACDSTSGNMVLAFSGAADELSASATSGSIRLDADTAAKVSLTATSGAVQVTAASVDELSLHTTSGSQSLSLTRLGKGSMDSTSGSLTLAPGQFDQLRADTTSGTVTARLPAAPGFTAHLDTTSGRVDTALPLARSGSTYTCGDASASLSISTTSGNITLMGE